MRNFTLDCKLKAHEKLLFAVDLEKSIGRLNPQKNGTSTSDFSRLFDSAAQAQVALSLPVFKLTNYTGKKAKSENDRRPERPHANAQRYVT
jgi:hypothetical protein